MKNVSHIIYGVVAFAVISFSVLSFSSCKDTVGQTTAGATGSASGDAEGFSGATLPIAYVNVDSILVHYEYSKDLTDRVTKKAEDIRVTINQKTKKLEKDMAEFQRKADNNAFLSQERAQQEYVRLQKQDQELQQTAQRLQNEWAMDQQKENMMLADSVRNAVKLYNQTANYQMIFNMRELENIILANPKNDITDQIIALLNSRYKPEAKK